MPDAARSLFSTPPTQIVNSSALAPRSFRSRVLQSGVALVPALDITLVFFAADQPGVVTATVDWSDTGNDIQAALLRGRCTREQIEYEFPECDASALVAISDEENPVKPVILTASVAAGRYTLLIVNFGPRADTVSYRVEGNVSADADLGTARFLGATLPSGSTVTVAPLQTNGQQVSALSFSAAITLVDSLTNATVRAWVRTPTTRCLGGGRARVNFEAGREQVVTPASMSNPGGVQPVCALPYITTHVEFEVLDSAGTVVLQQQFRADYLFVASTSATRTFSFVLPAGSTRSVLTGPVQAGNGSLLVRLNYSGGFAILGCVGTSARCTPFGGTSGAQHTIVIPASFPAGPIQVLVYFRPNTVQPPGDATGTVSFTYNPL